MTASQILPHGTWPTPIDAALVAAHDGRPEYLGAVGGELWWTEPRPEEGGRRALMRLRAPGGAVSGDAPEEPESVLPEPWNVRNRVMEYGGLPWAAVPRARGGPLLVFTHHGDQRLYAVEPDVPGSAPRPLTPVSGVGGGLRWADPVLRPGRDEVWCVLEEFTGERPTDVRRVPAAVPLDGSAAEDRTRVRELSRDGTAVGGGDFVTGPRVSPDGRHVAWLAWDHPRMPWDGTELRLAELTGDGVPGEARTVLGGPEESVAQVEWAADGSLLAVTDASGWWNLHRVDPGGGPSVNLCPREEEFGDALWRPGQRWFAPLEDGTVAVLHGRGAKRLGVLDPRTGAVVDATGPWTEWSAALAVDGTRVVGIAAGPHTAHEIVELDTATGHSTVVAAHHTDPVDPAYYPVPVPRTVTAPGGREVHAQVYPPRNPRARGPQGTPPPYVIWAHGGPTGRAPAVLDLEIAYFTSRGIGVAEVNYGGSTGYGRAYRERLRGRWGVVDVEDCAAVARALADEGSADRRRLAIRGGSAGGWTAAVSLTSPAAADVYACGTISYPILEPESWSGDATHDFESRYLEGLIGHPDRDAERYRRRSPARNAARLTVPFLLLQGLDDAICPPEQCERFLAALAGAGGEPVPHTYLTFAGEGHGFRRAETIVRAVEAELELYRRTFGAR
ncbi:prolyl oligopeptidase family serine peptidase [Streptomyces chumphonensis]|uniref:S9 family peptidase n=1 Tax=Streptomyces chumphonensis TaxID=1214925 RepID=UPI002963FDB1|nr:prolyl oligopeptidase family serine peptidase [Streptomyces chumphonensis]